MRTASSPDNFFSRKSFLLAWLFLAVLVFSAPNKAWAQEDVVCCAEEGIVAVETGIIDGVEAAGWLADAAHIAAEIQQWVVENMDDVIDTVSDVLSDEIEALTTMVGAQAEVDAQSRETQKKATLDASLGYSMNLPGVGTSGQPGAYSGYNACAMTTGFVMLSGNATADLTRALELYTAQSKVGGGALTAQHDIMEECFRGLRNTSDPSYGAKLTAMGCPDASGIFGGNYIDTDTKTSAVLDQWHYTIPTGVKTNPVTGQMILPYAVNPAGVPPGTPPVVATAEEMNFVAAIFACRRFRAPMRMPPNTAAGATSTISDAADIEATLDEQSASSAVNNICVREVARRTRVSQAAANAAATIHPTGVLQEVYQAQVARCQEQNVQHIYGDGFADQATDLADCTLNGRSQLELDRNEACKYDTPYFATYLSGTGMEVEDHIEDVANNENQCQKFVRKWQKDNTRLSNSMNPKNKKTKPE